MLRTAIIEDEFMIRETLEALVGKYFSAELEVVGSSGEVPEALVLLEKEKPDLVFLDIELSLGTGFDLLEALGQVDFEVIFITAYSQYALKAIKFAAVDYLLKPIALEDLQAAVAKVQQRRPQQNTPVNFQAFLTNQSESDPQLHKFPVSTTRGIRLLTCREIIRLEADGSYTHFHLDDGHKETVSRTLKNFADRLLYHGFYRIHHSHLINLTHVRQFLRQHGGFVEMKDGSHVPVSRRKRTDFLKILSPD